MIFMAGEVVWKSMLKVWMSPWVRTCVNVPARRVDAQSNSNT
jgi:hypothetical protein